MLNDYIILSKFTFKNNYTINIKATLEKPKFK